MFNLILVVDGWGISFGSAVKWILLDLTADKSTLIQVMTLCRQATSHHLSQYWHRSVSPYGVTRPRWVKWCHSVFGRPWRFGKSEHQGPLLLTEMRLTSIGTMGLLPDTRNCGLCMRRECRELFPSTDFKGNRLLAIPACIVARASRTCRDACRDR